MHPVRILSLRIGNQPRRTDLENEYRLGVDVGGTHTDLVLVDKVGGVRVEKVASTPGNPSIAVLEGIGRLFDSGVAPNDIGFFGHGTTVTTNALLQMKGARTGLLINEGFRAVQEVQTGARETNQFELKFRRPAPLAPQSRTAEIAGRIDHRGREIQPLDEAGVGSAATRLREAGVESFAVCFLFSFMNPAHERRAAEIIRGVAPDAHVSLSSEVLPRIREWPRLSTCLINAYLEPVLARYVKDLDAGLDARGIATPSRFLMQSNGGVMPLRAAEGNGRTVHTLLSGPAAGVQACAHVLGRGQGRSRLIAMDMGGTSCDIAFIEDGAPLEVTEGTIAGRKLDVPALDIATISAGGGTVARVNAANHLTVGPDSAGADPGPVCYGLGGSEPTVTDADLISGFLNPDYLLGGATALDRGAAERAVESRIARPMALSPRQAASGIVRLINARMADEIRVQAAKKVVDLAAASLVAFGGAGPVHAAMVAGDLGIARVLVPPRPGAFSALGLLCSDVVHDYIRSDIVEIRALGADRAEACFQSLEAQAERELAAEGLGESARQFVREIDLRYAGQGYEIRTPLAGPEWRPLTRAGLAQVEQRFHALHQHLHGHSAPDSTVEAVSFRLRVRVPVAKPDPEGDNAAAEPGAGGKRIVTFDGRTEMEAPVHGRGDIGDAAMPGPLIVEQIDATTIVPPGWAAHRDRFGNIVLEAR